VLFRSEATDERIAEILGRTPPAVDESAPSAT